MKDNMVMTYEERKQRCLEAKKYYYELQEKLAKAKIEFEILRASAAFESLKEIVGDRKIEINYRGKWRVVELHHAGEALYEVYFKNCETGSVVKVLCPHIRFVDDKSSVEDFARSVGKSIWIL